MGTAMAFRADRLKQRREALGFSQRDLNERLGWKSNYASKYERGESIPSVDNIAKLAQELDTSTDWLLGLTDEHHARLGASELSAEERGIVRAMRSGELSRILLWMAEQSRANKK